MNFKSISMRQASQVKQRNFLHKKIPGLVIFCCLILSEAIAQVDYRNQFVFRHDNDFFAIQTNEDRYYTYGISAEFRREAQEKNLAYRLVKAVTPSLSSPLESFGLELMAYTPSNYDSADIRFNFDRPYAGLFFGQYQINGSLPGSNLNVALNAGVMGPSANAGRLQNWFHSIVGVDSVPGWGYQIGDQLLLHLIIEWRKELLKSDYVSLLSESKVSLGSVFSDATQGARLVIGKFAGANKSSLYGNELRNDSEPEIFLSVYGAVSLVAYDATVKGGFFSDEFDNRDLNRVVGMYGASLHFLFGSFGASLDMVQHTGRLEKSFSHRFGRVELSFRF